MIYEKVQNSVKEVKGGPNKYRDTPHAWADTRVHLLTLTHTMKPRHWKKSGETDRWKNQEPRNRFAHTINGLWHRGEGHTAGKSLFNKQH